MKIDLKYLKDNFDLKKFISSLDKEIKLGSTKALPLERPDCDNRWKSASSIFFLTYKSKLIQKKNYSIGINIFDEVERNKKLNKDLFLLEKNGKLLPSISKNFEIISSIKCKIKNTLLYCLSSKINKAFYLFINTEAKVSNCYIEDFMVILSPTNKSNKVRTSTEFAFFKTKQKDKAITQMINLSKGIEKGGFFIDGFFNEKQINKINILEEKIPLTFNKPQLRESKFNIELFFNALSKKNIPKFVSDKPLIFFNYALAKGYDYNEEKYSTNISEWVDDDYSKFENPTKSFAHLSKELSFIPLIQLIDNHPEGMWKSKEEIGYLYSKKSNISFIIRSSFFHSDRNSDIMEYGRYDESKQPEVILKFEKLDKKKLKNISKVLLKHLFKKRLVKGHLCNLINLNNKFTWDQSLLIKVFKKCVKAKREQENQYLDLVSSADYYIKPQDEFYKIWFFLQKEKIMTSKNPASGCHFKDAYSYKAAFNMHIMTGTKVIKMNKD